MKRPMLIAVRGYAQPEQDGGQSRKIGKWTRKALASPSNEALIFDCETTSDHAQSLRFGTYQCRKRGELKERGIFYEPSNPSALTELDICAIRSYAKKHGLVVRTKSDFVRDVFYRYAFHYGAVVVGFNLPFDLGCLAIEIATSRAHDMRDAFSFKLDENKYLPAVLVRHLNSRAAFMRFASLGQMDGRSSRKRGIKTRSRRGYFQDVKTLAAAMLGSSHSLASLARALQTPHQKLDAGTHGRGITDDYLMYAMQDTQVTWECYEKLTVMYSANGLSGTPAHRIYSEASFGKACLNEMGIIPLAKSQPNVPPAMMGIIIGTYYGGRSEVRIRRDITRVLYCDFRSMYPTVCTLMGLWGFVTAQNFQWQDWTDKAAELLKTVTLERVKDKHFWKDLAILVQIVPDGDVFPVRSAYSGTSRTIGLNYLSAEFPIWFTLADCIAAKLATGRSPQVIKAFKFAPGPRQTNLKPITLGGDASFSIDPSNGDFYRDLIVRRGRVQSQLKRTNDCHLRERLDAQQMTLKLIANSTGYGIFAEQNVQSFDRPRALRLFGLEGMFPTTAKSYEEPGTHFHPLIATLITGAARLMLACAECVVARHGLNWAFCDTDSLAIARPEGMTDDVFLSRCETVTAWLEGLEPYGDGKPLFKVEDQNFATRGRDRPEPLYCLAISAKRYVLFNLDPNGRPLIRKAVAHGLGHLMEPYRDDQAPKSIPAPVEDLHKLGVRRWQYDLWYRIILAALEGHPDQVDLGDIPGLDRPARSRYGANTAPLRAWFRGFNAGKPLYHQVKSFNFLLAYQVSIPAMAQAVAEGRLDAAWFGEGMPAVVSPFCSDPDAATETCFDRRTGRPVPSFVLRTYREAISDYHLHSEAKFENGELFDRGITARRHVEAIAVEYIGKEANRWEEQFFLGEVPEAQIEYGRHPNHQKKILAMLRETSRKFGISALARAARLSRQQLHTLLDEAASPRDATIARLCRAALRLDFHRN